MSYVSCRNPFHQRWKELEDGGGGCHGTIQEGQSEHVEDGKVTEDDPLFFTQSSFSTFIMCTASFDLSDCSLWSTDIIQINTNTCLLTYNQLSTLFYKMATRGQ
jgi:hypothetical protein